MSDLPTLPSRVFFERVLLPYRSLPPRGFTILMLVLAAISIAAGTLFVSLGAWPVCGFFGLDVGLVYLAFRLSYRSARQREMLRSPTRAGPSVSGFAANGGCGASGALGPRDSRSGWTNCEPARPRLARREPADRHFLPPPMRGEVRRRAASRWRAAPIGGAQLAALNPAALNPAALNPPCAT